MTTRKSGKSKKQTARVSGKRVTVVLPDETYETYERVAEREYISVAQVVTRVAVEFAVTEEHASRRRTETIRNYKDRRLHSPQVPAAARGEPAAVSGGPGLNRRPGAGFHTELFSELLGIDREEARDFFLQAKQGSSLLGSDGLVLLEVSAPEALVFECVVQRDVVARFSTPDSESVDRPVTLVCRQGKATLLFTGPRFHGLPVMLEFSDDSLCDLPPEADCVLTVEGPGTIAFASFDVSGAGAKPTVSFDSIAKALVELAEKDALVPLPGVKGKGLRINLGRRG